MPSGSIQKDVSIQLFELAETYDLFVNRLAFDDLWNQNTTILKDELMFFSLNVIDIVSKNQWNRNIDAQQIFFKHLLYIF